MNLAERIKAAQGERTLKSVEVAAWPDDNGNPTVIYFTDITVGESAAMSKRVENGAETDVAGIAVVIVEKALNADGERIFERKNAPEHVELLKKEPISVVLPIFEAMMQTDPDAAKN